MIKILIVFIVGLIEQLLYTSYLISLDKRQKYLSSFLMFIYMVLYLFIIAWAIQGKDTAIVLLVYALSCGIGNYIRLIWEKK